MAFSYLKLSDQMVSTLKEMMWNLVTIALLLVASRYLPPDVMLVVAVITLLFGPVLVTCFFQLVGFLLFLATWAPNVFLALLVAGFFSSSHLGAALTKSCGLDATALQRFPGYDAAAACVAEGYARVKGLLKDKTPFVKLDVLDDVEKAVGKIEVERSVHERLDGIEEMLKNVLDNMGTKTTKGLDV